MNRRGPRMTWLVARRELQQRGRSRVFAIGTVVLLLAVALGVVLPAVLSRGAKPERVGVVGNTATLTGVVAEAGRLAGVKVIVVPEPDVATAKAGLRSGDLGAVLVGGTEVLVKQVPIGGESSAGGTLPGALAQLAGLTRLFEQVPGAAAAAANGITLPVRGLEPPSGSLANRLTGLFTVVLVWVLISVYGSQIALGIGEEKSSRIVEVLLASVRPVQLLVGKVLGIGLLALAQTAAMVVVFVVAGFASGSSLVHGAAIGIVLTGGVFIVLGYAFYCTAFAAAGSLVSRQSDVNSTIMPVQLPLILAYVLSYTVIYANGANAFYRVLGFLPPTAPVAMPVLYAAGDVPVWQVVVSGLLCAAGTVWMARLAAGIYSRSILRTGGRVRLSQVLRALPGAPGGVEPKPAGERRAAPPSSSAWSGTGIVPQIDVRSLRGIVEGPCLIGGGGQTRCTMLICEALQIITGAMKARGSGSSRCDYPEGTGARKDRVPSAARDGGSR